MYRWLSPSFPDKSIISAPIGLLLFFSAFTNNPLPASLFGGVWPPKPCSWGTYSSLPAVLCLHYCFWVTVFSLGVIISGYSITLLDIALLVPNRIEDSSDAYLVIAWASVICCSFVSDIDLGDIAQPILRLPLIFQYLISLLFVQWHQCCFWIICDGISLTCPCLEYICTGASCNYEWREADIFQLGVEHHSLDVPQK